MDLRLSLAALIGLLAACDGARRVPVSGPSGARADAASVARGDADGGIDPAADASGPALDAAGASPDASGPALDAASAALDASGAAPDAAGGAPDASSPAPDAGPAPATVSGYVGVSQVLQASSQLTTATAGFYRAATLGACTETTDGPCRIYTCPTAPTQPTPLDGGALTARVNGRVLTAQYSAANGYYQPAVLQQAAWQGGETIDVQLAGGPEVPPLTAALTAPAQLTITAPVIPAPGTPLVAARGQPLVVAWRGASAGAVLVGVGGTSGGVSVSAQCTFSPGSGGGMVPATALARLPPSNTTFQAYVGVSQLQRVGGADINVQSTVNMVGPTGNNAAVLLELR